MRRALLTLLMLSAGGLAYADTVTLKNGRVVHGKVLENTGKQVTIDHGCGKISLPRKDIASIEENDLMPPTSASVAKTNSASR